MTDMQTAAPTPRSWRDDASTGAISGFLFREARLLDEHDYDGWLELWDDAGTYLIPANGDDLDPENKVSIVYDNRARLGRRVAQLQTGYRYAQLPQSRTQHFVSNIEIAHADAAGLDVRCAYMIAEARFGDVRSWAGRALYELIPVGDGDFRILRKTVIFINNDLPINTLAFLP